MIFQRWDRKLNLRDRKGKAFVPCYLVPVPIVVLESSMGDFLYSFSSLVYYLSLQLEAHICVYMLIRGLKNQLTSYATRRAYVGKKHIVKLNLHSVCLGMYGM